MNQLKVFENPEFGQMRIAVIDGKPWFSVTDVCEALDIRNSRMAMTRLDDDEKGVSSIDTPGGPQEMNVVNEYGLYSLVLGSRKKEARQFKRWVTHEVLPSIRKHGGYMMGQEEWTREELLAKSLLYANKEAVYEGWADRISRLYASHTGSFILIGSDHLACPWKEVRADEAVV